MVIKFPALDKPNGKELGYSFLAWTTTPWTLPSNLALCLNPDMDYVKIKDKTHHGEVFVVMEARLSGMFKSPDDYEVLEKRKGKDFLGVYYRPLFDYFVSVAGKTESTEAFKCLNDGYVTAESGTGIVHQAPYFGEDDHRVCLAAGVITKSGPIVCPVDASGKYTHEVTDFAGKYLFGTILGQN